MIYAKNVPNAERVLRVVLGSAAAVAAVVLVNGSAGWLLAAGAAGLVVSGLVGFCPACAMAGRRLKD